MAMQRGGSAAEREAFFSSLPAEEFSPLETALRKCLIDFLNSRRDASSFPLIEWIDRRLGGEIATVRDENGQGEIRFQSGQGGGGAEAFFERLPQDAFSPEEEALREAIFDFLAAWKSSALANAADLQSGKGVKERMAALLPRDVKLEDWIERRIGGEVQLTKDARTGQQVINLSASARPIVAKKYEELQKAERAATPGKGAAREAPRRPGSGPGDAAAGAVGGGGGKGASKDGGKSPRARRPAVAAVVDKEEWLSSLPSDQLTAEETNLRQALLSFLQSWPKRRPANRPPGAPIYFQEATSDPEVQRCRLALLPGNVPMRDWIDRRIGGEVELRGDDVSGKTEISLRGSKPPAAAGATADAVPDTAVGAGAAAGPGAVGGAAGGGKPSGKAAGKGAGGIEAFFSRLPADELTQAELDLREAVLKFIDARSTEGRIPLLSEAFKDVTVAQARAVLMPAEVPLRQWLDKRVGGEFEVFKDAKGFSCLRLRGEASASAAEAQAEAAAAPAAEAAMSPVDARERFFETLPGDRFTPEEERLREALLNFLDGWKLRDPPTLTHTSADTAVRTARGQVLPKGMPVALKDWIDRRMGGELEMIEHQATAMVYFGHRGSLDHQAVQALGAENRKRPLEEHQPQPQRPKPAVARGKDGGVPGGKGGKGGMAEAARQAPQWKVARQDLDRVGGGKSAPKGGPGKGGRW